MGLFDAIKGLFNPEIISRYEEIVSSHSEAYRRWKGRQHYTALSSSVNTSPTYNDKYYIATHRDEILLVEKEIAEEKAFQKRKKMSPSNYRKTMQKDMAQENKALLEQMEKLLNVTF